MEAVGGRRRPGVLRRLYEEAGGREVWLLVKKISKKRRKQFIRMYLNVYEAGIWADIESI